MAPERGLDQQENPPQNDNNALRSIGKCASVETDASNANDKGEEEIYPPLVTVLVVMVALYVSMFLVALVCISYLFLNSINN